MGKGLGDGVRAVIYDKNYLPTYKEKLFAIAYTQKIIN